MSEKMTPYQKQVWFYFTRGMIQGALDKKNLSKEEKLKLLLQFNKIGPELDIRKEDLEVIDEV